MKKVVLACAAIGALAVAAPAQDLPTLSQFLSNCYRDNAACRTKLKDYVRAGTQQHIICLPEDTSESEAASEMLRWLRDEKTHPATLNDGPFDDGLYEAATKLYPCAAPEPPPPPPPADPNAPPPSDQAAPPQ